MKNGILRLKVFRRRSAACKTVAALSAFAMLALTPVTALAAPVALTGPADVLANVNGGAVVSGVTGNMTLDTDLTKATINLTQGGAGLINWSALNVGNGQSLGFTGGDFYNVVGGASASQIAGTLKASGSLWIFNPAGVSFVNGSAVNVGGLFSVAAAGLENESAIKDAILSGTALPTPMLMASSSAISVGSGAKFNVGGDLALIGKSVTVESGADLSKVNSLKVGAGRLVDVDNVGDGKVRLDISQFADVDDDINVTFGGGADANIAVGDESHAGDVDVLTEGSVFVNEALVAKGDVTFTTLPKRGAEIVVDHKQMSVASGKLLQGKSVSATAAGKISVGGDLEAVGGDVALASADDVIVNGTVSASGLTGGNISISGVNVGNFGTIAANGTVGDAGNVRIDAANAVALGGDSLITANAGVVGNGGNVAVVAQNYANIMAGSRIEAKGGAESGNGGFVETSGYKAMNIKGSVDATAANGKTGTWLIDPSNITISSAATSDADVSASPFTPTGDGANIQVDDVLNGLDSADLEIMTTNVGGTEDGNIAVNAAIDYSAKSHSLTLTAANDIDINADINGGNNNFTANAGNAIDVNAAVTANDVGLTAAASGVSLDGAIKASTLTINAGDNVAQSVAADPTVTMAM